MTHPDTPEVGGETPVDSNTDPKAAFEDIAESFFDEPEEEEAEEAELDESEEELDDEPEADDLPAIDPPNSLTAEEKEAFKNLPREAQEFTARRIGELERGFQAKAQEAARVRQETEHAAYQQLAQIEQGYAEQLHTYAQQLMPQRPDPAMLQYDPQGFYAQQAQYESGIAQQQQLQQQAQQLASQAQAREQQVEQARMAQEHQIIVEQFPEYLDPTNGPKLRAELSNIARELGYPPELIAEARAADVLAMKKVADLKVKADKYDALQKGKMEKVRAAKGLPKVAKPGVAVGGEQARQTRSDAAFARAKAGRSVAEKAAGFEEWAKLNNIV